MLHWDTLGLAHPSPPLGNPAHRSKPRRGLPWHSPSAERPNDTLRSGPREQHPRRVGRGHNSQASLQRGNATGTRCQARICAASRARSCGTQRGGSGEQTCLSEQRHRTDGVSQQIPAPAQTRGSSQDCLTVTPTHSALVLAPTDNDRQQESPARQRSHLLIAA